ncbi:helix-turn-helix transcriptional regulator [Dactylosporangium sp. NPDC000244]|uniref:helix-turn-helix domain-containing protein n=1 Tax=Dactylosporangium sp. NPDC000244 TaxID=3154365 RepID=UPI00332FAF78
MSTSPSSAARQAQEDLGARLRELRKGAGLTGRALAAATGQPYWRVSRIEHGVQPPTPTDIAAWCKACSADSQVPDLLATLGALKSAYIEFRRQGRAGMKHVLGAHTLARYEQTTVFRIYEHNVIPGLFQTAEYCAAMLAFWIGFLQTPNDVEEAVTVRMERQRVIHQRGTRFLVVLEEQALRTWFGGATVQAGQLERLLTVMSMPTVSVGIIPLMTERGGVASAGFWIFDDHLVALETPTANIEVSRPQEIELYSKMFEHLQSVAVYGEPARAIVRAALGELS